MTSFAFWFGRATDYDKDLNKFWLISEKSRKTVTFTAYLYIFLAFGGIEATSVLDTDTEKRVAESIILLAGNKTLIVIAHRLSAVEHCDCIYLLEKGRIVKSGSFTEVIKLQALTI